MTRLLIQAFTEEGLLYHAMGTCKNTFTPRVQIRTISVEHHDWMIAAIEYKYAVLRVNGDSRDFLPSPA